MAGQASEVSFGKKKHRQKFRKSHKNQCVDSNRRVCTVDQMMLKIRNSGSDFEGPDLKVKWAEKGGIMT